MCPINPGEQNLKQVYRLSPSEIQGENNITLAFWTQGIDPAGLHRQRGMGRLKITQDQQIGNLGNKSNEDARLLGTAKVDRGGLLEGHEVRKKKGKASVSGRAAN